MPIETAHTLSEANNIQLHTLTSECLQHDKYLPPIYWTQMIDVGVPSLFLFKEAGILLGHLKLFFFDNNTTEMVLLVSPQARRQGIATKLYQTALPPLTKKGINEIRFCFAHNQSQWLTKHNATFIETEYVLENVLNTGDLISPHVKHASLQHAQDLIELDILCFEERSLNQDRVQKLLKQINYQLLIIEENQKAIAKLHLKFENNTAYIYDVAVHPEHQRQGHANTILKHALAISNQLKVKKISLDVVSNNENALNLYLKNGFTIKQSHHYWKLQTSRGN